MIPINLDIEKVEAWREYKLRLEPKLRFLTRNSFNKLLRKLVSLISLTQNHSNLRVFKLFVFLVSFSQKFFIYLEERYVYFWFFVYFETKKMFLFWAVIWSKSVYSITFFICTNSHIIKVFQKFLERNKENAILRVWIVLSFL